MRDQVCAYPLSTRLAYVPPGADRAHRRHAPGRKLDRECLCNLHLQRIRIRPALGPRLSWPIRSRQDEASIAELSDEEYREINEAQSFYNILGFMCKIATCVNAT